MEITWLGHACFRVRGRDVTIITDPYGGDDLGYPPLAVGADVVTVSHEHPHHASIEGIAGTPRVLRGPGEYEIGGAMIWGIRTRRADGQASPDYGRNTAYVVQLEEVTLCHLGDLGHQLTTEQLTHMKDCDVLFVPVGGHCTVDGAQASEIVAQIEPKLIVPMHYATPQTAEALPLEGVDRFCREMGASGVLPQPRLNVTPGSLPGEPTVVLLEPRR